MDFPPGIKRLSTESAMKYYDRILTYHNDDREFTKKVHDFQHDLEHYILNEITGLQEYYNQFGKLLENQEKWEYGNKTGFIPPFIVTCIRTIKVSRNDAVHRNFITPITYKFCLQAMSDTICFFSKIPIPNKLNKILEESSCIDISDNDNQKSDKINFDKVIIDRLKKPIEKDLNITTETTPVIFFGNYEKAKACTIGINPSYREFLDNNKIILAGKMERLCSRKKLGKKDDETLTDENVKEILNYCNRYFEKNPLDWFNEIEYMIGNYGYSYYNNTCIHLNLVQWATDPRWSYVNKTIRKKHLNDDSKILKMLLDNNNFEKIFLNGESVAKEVMKIGIKLKKEKYNLKKVINNSSYVTKYIGNYNNIEIIGWSRYLQQYFGGLENIDLLYETIK
ncbi:MAG: hypothetical protein FWD87_02280 [Spirochaetaceae bacterium]|nr:hypothetical protein [Spirochaetaceae bacterium]